VGTSTYKRNHVYKQLIGRFAKASKKEYFIKDVNANFKLNFEVYCNAQGYAHNTTARTIKFIKRFVIMLSPLGQIDRES
jgi:hypothetical protein